jgi:peptidoglycan/LPS O-acetylase OafA/YrhL
LSVEEQFYVVWFFVMMYVPAKPLPWIMGVAFVAEPLVRCTWLAPEHTTFRTWTLWANCDGLVLGALLSRLEARGREFPLSGAAAALIALSLTTLAALVSPQSPTYSPIASVLVSTLCAWVVWRARRPLGGIVGRVLSHEAVVYVGRISYGIYLYHVIVPGLSDALGIQRLPLVWRLFEAGSLPGFIVHCAIVIALAGLSFRYFEIPLRNLATPGTMVGARMRRESVLK